MSKLLQALQEASDWRELDAGIAMWSRLCKSATLFYAPGCVVAATGTSAERLQRALQNTGDRLSPTEASWAQALRDHAKAAASWREDLLSSAFSPIALTLFVTNACNLACSYCFTDAGPLVAGDGDLSPGAVSAAAALVADNCRASERPLVLAIHGGGEPMLRPSVVDAALTRVQQACRAAGVELFSYVATNGVMPTDKVRWLSERFDLVGLSCDGPPDIQDAHRRTISEAPTSPIVERTARTLVAEGQAFSGRATITPLSIDRQPEIVGYLCDLGASEIVLEPVYTGGRAHTLPWTPDDAPRFVDGLCEAARLGAARGVQVLTSCARVDSLHGPYCNVLRHTLNLTPEGVATACFKASQGDQAIAAGVAVGQWDGTSGAFELDADRCAEMVRALLTPAPPCSTCWNRYHCARLCPNVCQLEPRLRTDGLSVSFSCGVSQLWAWRQIENAANPLLLEARNDDKDGVYGIRF